MSDIGNKGPASDPAKGPGGTGKGKATREHLKDEAAAAFSSASAAPADDSEARRKLKASLETIEAKAAEIRRWGAERSEVARDVVEDHPLVVTASAFGVGLLIGLLAARL